MRRLTLIRLVAGLPGGFLAGLFVVMVAVLPSPMSAQRMGGGHFASPGVRSAHLDSGNLIPRFGSRYGSFAGSLAGSLGWFGDPLYADALYNSGYPVASQPPIVIVQGGAAAAPTPESPVSSVQPLMIELQGGRYVRVSGSDSSGAELVDRESDSPSRQTDSLAHSTAAQELPPAILVFRDGHHEQVTGYTIADGVLYAVSDFYTNGSWNRKIELSSLNLPETVESNKSQGVQFRLPAAANEVIVRP